MAVVALPSPLSPLQSVQARMFARAEHEKVARAVVVLDPVDVVDVLAVLEFAAEYGAHHHPRAGGVSVVPHVNKNAAFFVDGPSMPAGVSVPALVAPRRLPRLRTVAARAYTRLVLSAPVTGHAQRRHDVFGASALRACVATTFLHRPRSSPASVVLSTDVATEAARLPYALRPTAIRARFLGVLSALRAKGIRERSTRTTALLALAKFHSRIVPAGMAGC